MGGDYSDILYFNEDARKKNNKDVQDVQRTKQVAIRNDTVERETYAHQISIQILLSPGTLEPECP